MSIAFQAASAAVTDTASTATITWPGSPSGQMLMVVFAFDGVAAGSGPYVQGVTPLGPTHGWFRTCYQAPSGTGTGLEIWNTYDWSSGPTTPFAFFTSQTFIARGAVYTGQLDDFSANPVRAAVTAQVTGNNPATPSIFAFLNEMVIAVGAEAMSSPGFGTPTSPSGFTQRWDSAQSGFGTAEQTIADQLASTDETVGPVSWTANGDTGSSRGASAILAVRPATSPVGSSTPLIEITFPLT